MSSDKNRVIERAAEFWNMLALDIIAAEMQPPSWKAMVRALVSAGNCISPDLHSFIVKKTGIRKNTTGRDDYPVEIDQDFYEKLVAGRFMLGYLLVTFDSSEAMDRINGLRSSMLEAGGEVNYKVFLDLLDDNGFPLNYTEEFLSIARIVRTTTGVRVEDLTRYLDDEPIESQDDRSSEDLTSTDKPSEMNDYVRSWTIEVDKFVRDSGGQVTREELLDKMDELGVNPCQRGIVIEGANLVSVNVYQFAPPQETSSISAQSNESFDVPGLMRR